MNIAKWHAVTYVSLKTAFQKTLKQGIKKRTFEKHSAFLHFKSVASAVQNEKRKTAAMFTFLTMSFFLKSINIYPFRKKIFSRFRFRDLFLPHIHKSASTILIEIRKNKKYPPSHYTFAFVAMFLFKKNIYSELLKKKKKIILNADYITFSFF